MYFFKESGKQILDLTGNLILSFNSSLVKCRAPSAAPHAIKDAKKIMINELTFIKKIAATFIVLGFIWGKNKALVETDTALNKPFVKPKDINFNCENCLHDGYQSIHKSPCTGCGDTEFNNFELVRPGLKTESDGFE